MGIDILWRRRAVRMLQSYQPKVVLDIATGTGDFALAATRLDADKIIALDISPGMLEIGKKKIAARKLQHLIEFRLGDSEKLQLEDESVDAITVGFGVRNFENLPQGLKEIHRVLRKDGAVVILEPSYPTQFPLKQLFQLHFRYITPAIGKLISGDSAAYTYLPESVKAFPNGKEFVEICKNVGFSEAIYKPLTLGICSLYLLEK